MAGDVLGICQNLASEGVINNTLMGNCTRVVENTVTSGKLAALSQKISENVTATSSEMLEGGSITGKLSELSGKFSESGFFGKVLSLVTQLITYMLSSLGKILDWFGITITASQTSLLTLILSVIMLAALFDYFIKLFGKWVINSVVGLVGLLILHYLFGVTVPLTLFTIAIVAAFGVPGLLAVIMLHIGGIV